MLRPLILLCVMALCASGCVLQNDRAVSTSSGGAIATSPPRDFWIGITVTGPVRENATAYDALPRAMRPARYVVEADRILRAALGPGARDESFPPPTRRLSAAEFTDLYNAAVEAGLLDPDHPFTVRTTPPPPAPDANPSTINRTTFIISTHAGEKRHTLVMEASPQASEESRRAARVVDWLANKAWVAPSAKP